MQSREVVQKRIAKREAGRAANMQQGCCKDAAKMQTGLAEVSQNLEAEREQEIEEEVGLQGRSNRRGGDNVISLAKMRRA
jgi:hypothetical protein